ncbi:MAG: 4'-phosphopantetheinyl transferase superfamily protein [Thermoanaerobaculia bacterium]
MPGRKPSRTRRARGLPELSPSDWKSPPAEVLASPADVDVWRIDLERAAGSIPGMDATLAEAERDRAGRFVFDGDRERFLAAHGVLREILARYLRRDPAGILFRTTGYGKPSLEAGSAPDPDDLRFNLSHSGDRALCAVTREREIGVDIEKIRNDFSVYELAERFFSPAEVAALRALPENSLREGFFTCWTRKEAFIKARGEGLSIPLDSFDVTVGPGSPARLLAVRGAQEAARWTIRELPAGSGYVAAVAVEGEDDFRVRCFDWSPR